MEIHHEGRILMEQLPGDLLSIIMLHSKPDVIDNLRTIMPDNIAVVEHGAHKELYWYKQLLRVLSDYAPHLMYKDSSNWEEIYKHSFSGKDLDSKALVYSAILLDDVRVLSRFPLCGQLVFQERNVPAFARAFEQDKLKVLNLVLDACVNAGQVDDVKISMLLEAAVEGWNVQATSRLAELLESPGIIFKEMAREHKMYLLGEFIPQYANHPEPDVYVLKLALALQAASKLTAVRKDLDVIRRLAGLTERHIGPHPGSTNTRVALGILVALQ